MFTVALGHVVTLSRQKFKSGMRLPDNRDYSALIDLGVVIETTSKQPVNKNEPSIVSVTSEKVETTKTAQAVAKKKGLKTKKKKTKLKK